MSPLDAVAEHQAGQRRAVDPPIEEARQRPAGLLLHRRLEVGRADVPEARCAVETPEAARERLVAHKLAQHVQDHGRLVVDERAVDAAVAAKVPKPVAERDRSFGRLADRPAAHLPHHPREDIVAALALRVESGEVLGEALAQPLIVIGPPSDSLPPPLMRDLVGQEEVGIVLERRRVVPPRHLRRGQRLVERRKVRRAVAAGAIVFDDGNRQARIRRVVEQRLVEENHVEGAIGEFAAPADHAAGWRRPTS